MSERALLIRLSSLGDVALATSAVEALRRDRPDLTVEVLTKPAFAELFEGNPGVGTVHTWGPGVSPREMARALTGRNYALIADLHGNLRTRLLRLFLRGRWSVCEKGVVARRAAVFLRSQRVLRDAPHVTGRYARALAPLGVKGPALPRIHLDGATLAAAGELLAGAGWDGRARVAAFAPGAAWPTKAWPAPKWEELVASARERLGLFPLLLGGPADAPLCGRVLGGGPGCDASGRTTLRLTAALLARSALLVTNDSAPMHLAGATGTPVVALFGPTVRGFGFTPLGGRDRVVERDEPCRPCALHGTRRCPLGHFNCLQRIESLEVLGIIGEMAAK